MRYWLAIIVLMVVGFSLSCSQATSDFYGLELVNNLFANDIDSVGLQSFLEQDATNEEKIVAYSHVSNETISDFVASGYECSNFAVDLHNNAEKAGIQCAVVENHQIGHAFNAFNTTDKGLVFVDASSGYDCILVPVDGYSLCQYCKVREGVADIFLMNLGDPKEFKIRW